MTEKHNDLFYTVEQLAKRWGKSVGAIRNAVSQGKTPSDASVKIMGSLKFRKTDIEKIEAGEV